MIANLRKLSIIDIALVIALLVGAVFASSFSGTTKEAEQEIAALENRARAVEANLGQAQEVNLEEFQQHLEQAQAALTESPLPSEAEMIALTNQILQYAEENNIYIANWGSSHTQTVLQGTEYPATKHSLDVEGTVEALTGFIEAITQDPAAPILQSMNITGVKGNVGMWQMKLDLLVYYRIS